jgi:hypothetical protein
LKGLINEPNFLSKEVFKLSIATKAIFSAVGTNGKTTVL